ncbi:patj homolog isoform X1 [Malaya genurostris]|uniref:patj homolog isoform X1 n=1 Tax=Malaya genurostris TaxID=325434 RepID=UPI0026F3DAD0|nr:patj homolog isoform X1 [Malaya genurostris]XP_058443794.1 patj homolog isoform X1 [Malaya genurostris]
MVLSTEWSQVEIIDLINDGNGLGFMLVGGRSTGVVIKALIPGSVAERDGRLQSGDHVLQIGDVNLRGFSSEQVATVLRQTGHQVRIIVARPVEPTSPDYQALASHAPIIPTKMLTDPEELDRTLLQTAGYTSGAFLQSPVEESDELCPTHIEVVAVNNTINIDASSLALISPSSISIPQVLGKPLLDIDQQQQMPPPPLPPPDPQDYVDSPETPETETYEVELRKNVYGLGITVAGYVCEEEDLSGIFVKSIIEGSAAEMSGKIQINDRIVAVDGKSLSGVTNHQAVELLRNTDIAVKLSLERFLRGRKYEHLQVALIDTSSASANAASNPQLTQYQHRCSMVQSPSVTTLSICLAKSDADSMVTECGDCGIEPEMESATTYDSNVFLLENGDCSENGLYENGEIIAAMAASTAATPMKENMDLVLDGQGDTVRSASQLVTPIVELDPIIEMWQKQIPCSQVIFADIQKLSGLGISLEGTVEVEGGVEVRPHHYIRSILEDGPVGRDGTLKPGDELLQVNEHRLQGLKHIDVVKILKELPAKVRVICARGSSAPTVINTSQNAEAFEARSLLAGGLQSLQSLQGILTKAQSESSLYTSSTATLTDQQRSKSVEQVSGLALWTNEVIYCDIEKTERGFGFSILDYQDPLDTEGTVIVVRGLIPGGSAEATNFIFPGDRLVSVNEHSLQGATLDLAVSILKGIPLGTARIGLCRPLSTSDNNLSSTPETPTT